MYNFSIHCTPSNRVQVKIAPQYTKIKRGSSVPKSVDYSFDVDNYPLNYPHYLSAYVIAMLPEPPAFDPAAACPGTGLGLCRE